MEQVENTEIVASRNRFVWLHGLHVRGKLTEGKHSGGKITETTLHPEMFVFPILAVLT